MTTKNINAESVALETVSGEKVGRDPRRMTRAELIQTGHNTNSVLAAVRAMCIDCCGGQVAEVRKCTAFECPLWALRMGINPFARRELTETQKEQLRARAAAARAKRSNGGPRIAARV